MTRIQRTRLLDRNVQRRDARIFVIATEGAETEPQYFHGLQDSGVIDRRRVRIEVLGTEEGFSAPTHVLARLREFEAKYSLSAVDERWLVADVDRVGEKHLARVTQDALQGGFATAVSNPCFELWLLLHFAEPPAAPVTRRSCEAELRATLGGYDKSRLNAAVFTRDGIEAATRRAQLLDPNPADRWPQEVGTHMYRLASRLLQFA